MCSDRQVTVMEDERVCLGVHHLPARISVRWTASAGVSAGKVEKRLSDLTYSS